MFKAADATGPCRVGFASINKLSQHLRDRHGRAMEVLNAEGKLDYV
jgi:hypothetical protein